MMLSFELKKTTPGEQPQELDIVLDSAGLESLLAQLQFLKSRRTEHVHLMSESWGGNHLESRPQNGDAHSISHVRILLR